MNSVENTRKSFSVRTLALITTLTMGLAAAFSFAPQASLASPMSQAQAGQPITVPAGQTVTVQARGFCLDFGKPFPTQATTISGTAASNIQAALNYSIEKGYTNGNPQQVEQAVWFLRDNTWHSSDNAVAQEIVNNATTANAPAQPSGGTALGDAVSQNKVTVTATFAPQTSDHFYGDANVQIKNTGTSDIQVYFPIGEVFSVPGAAGNFQTLAAFQLNSGAAAQATASTTATSQSTPTEAILGTSTVVGTAVATSTTAATVEVTTPTTAATATTEVATPVTAVSTPTTEVATQAPVATATQEVAAAMPTATTATGTGSSSGTGGTTLPQTGAGDGSTLAIMLGVLSAGLVAIVLGVSLRRRHNES